MALSPLDVYTVKVANFIANAFILSLLDRNTDSEAGKLYSGREVCSQPTQTPIPEHSEFGSSTPECSGFLGFMIRPCMFSSYHSRDSAGH